MATSLDLRTNNSSSRKKRKNWGSFRKRASKKRSLLTEQGSPPPLHACASLKQELLSLGSSCSSIWCTACMFLVAQSSQKWVMDTPMLMRICKMLHHCKPWTPALTRKCIIRDCTAQCKGLVTGLLTWSKSCLPGWGPSLRTWNIVCVTPD